MGLFAQQIQAQEEQSSQVEVKYKAVIEKIEKAACPNTYEEGECYFVDLTIQSGDKKSQQVSSIQRIADDPRLEFIKYKEGQTVYLVETYIAGETGYYIKEPIRYPSILPLLLIFVVLVIGIGKLRGLSSLIGLVVTFAIIFGIIIPMMISGNNPLVVSIIGGTLMLTTSVYLSHGFNKKTSIALIGTIISILISAILASIYTSAVQLSGYSTDDATFLAQSLNIEINLQGILLASLILGSIGVLDDVTVGQSAIVFELHKANPNLSSREIFKRAMNVGKDHIASMVNTLVLAYSAASLPLVMLFTASSVGLEEIINTELISEEIVRTLVGSIGLVLSLPITTFLACYFIGNYETAAPRNRLQKKML